MIDEITRLRAAEVGLPAAESWPDPPLACFPLRIDWPGSRLEAEPYPVPVVDSRAGVEPTLWPSSLVKMQSYAIGRDWRVTRSYSRGCMPHGSTGRPGPVKDWYGLRLAAGDGARAAWMVHDGTSWKSMGIWGAGVQPLVGLLGVTAVEVWIAGMLDPVKFRNDLAASMREAERRRRETSRVSAAKRGSSHAN